MKIILVALIVQLDIIHRKVLQNVLNVHLEHIQILAHLHVIYAQKEHIVMKIKLIVIIAQEDIIQKKVLQYVLNAKMEHIQM
jgi:hypothetical protein